MDIGLEVLNRGKVAGAAPSLEQLFDEYVACERLVSDTERFSAYGDQLFSAFENVWSLGRVASKYNSNESLAVLNALVGQEFGGSFEAASVKVTVKNIWTRIKEFFAKIWDWIKTFFYRVLNFFTKAEDRLDKMAKEYEGKSEMKPWSYKGVDMNGGINPINVAAERDLENAKSVAQIDQAKRVIFAQLKGVEAEKPLALGEKEVAKAQTVIKNAANAIRSYKSVKKGLEDDYVLQKRIVASAEKGDKLEEAKVAQKRIAAKVAVCNKKTSVLMRTVASICANGRYKALKAAAAPAK